ncbi:prepilin-type N-terminal cleavage/methylation domain-containing protein [Pseudophaeobacter arcticus]|uniref:prepilin-type N-terminal cleavage/methylation domain-containing protein n=1 Tax=Pseudophaeobacter arcticus TaxID=385492 RepID=UPI003A97CFA7
MTRPQTPSPQAPESQAPNNQTSPQAAASDRGLSLIELVLAMAIFALVAVMGAQALTGMIRMRDGLTSRSSQTAALAEVTSLLRADLSALVPMLFYPPERAAPQAALRFWRRGEVTVLALSRGGLAQFDTGRNGALGSQPPGLKTGLKTGRVEWRLQNGQLSRSFWPSLIPADPRSRLQTGPPLGAALGGITALHLRSYWPQTGWVEGTAPAQDPGSGIGSITGGAADDDSTAGAVEVYSDTLPLAVELTLVTGHFGKISLVESLK